MELSTATRGSLGANEGFRDDVAYLSCLPDFIVMAAADEAELKHMVATSVAIDDRPSALRYPRGEGVGVVGISPAFFLVLSAFGGIGPEFRVVNRTSRWPAGIGLAPC